MKIEYSPRFKRLYKKLPLELKKVAEDREAIFRLNPFNPKLKTHKLSGPLSGYLAFSVDHKHRIIFSLIDSSHVRFHSIGDHSVYN
jgi:mRNA-degrading endonuclease YafQ of YafQ-DinJ toxin-antitoxin module